MERVELRRLAPDDWRTWRDVRLTLLADEPDAFFSSVERESGYDEARWRAMLDPERGVTTVAFAGTEPVGTASGVADGDEAMLLSMWVARAARGSGVADLLVRDIVAWAAATGYPRITLVYADTNDRARRFYERAGFVGTDTLFEHPERPGHWGRRMVNDIAPAG
jgi:ribosomal protein S18 acetylase RimI-like enzyme